MREKLQTTPQRSKIMGSIKGKGTKLEEKVSKALWAKGVRFRKNVKGMVGTPDIAIKKYKIVIFIDSCFWHACEIHGNKPKKNVEFWEKKLQRNIERDKQQTQYYKEKGWNILRVWEHQLKKESFDKTIEDIYQFILESKQKKIK
ncbi:very short patch repair endonuclease [Cytobacillus oceanisediminis]|uniref:very short patch repair endonuclease n=1 Tax=Cytobacillus oceanisediminis TaxID=665099 RepID=UPI00207A70E1|nr:very short patch repair endonuclease [Cytobacillus oceanisediminis]USK45523.1 very short patch repair endonuclease [Cytobacillus oceanisediminis]